MAAAASSYFAGPAILPSQRAAAAPDNSAVATPSPAKQSRDPRFSGCAPTTVRHIARSFAAADATGGGDPAISIDGVDATNQLTQDGSLKRIWQPLLYSEERDRPVTNFNEVVLHFIECLYMHLVNVRPKMQGQLPSAVQANVSTHEMQAQVAHTVQINAPAYMPFSGGVRDHQVDFVPQVNQGRFPSSVQTNTSTHVPFSGVVREQQVHFTPQPNQFSAYPGTGGQQHDLQTRVLEVMQQPDILALENGVHVDEVARRLGMPRAQIMVTAQRLVDLACLYSTIDEYHFKSLLNG
ncbi:unnamed protein product [Miscanthus lutarioriparius]|uniref:Replication protein A C-terminal domain-containing protein n=1 Tax=Miscanthus lutarioriparius TaxID=422564 RepID=A0A811S3E5_9POAL|nr:unnamed protein product [Miscanthus lutarioriparius]